VVPKRLVRLSFNQLTTSLGSLLDDAILADELRKRFELRDAEHRGFPPLWSPDEGTAWGDNNLERFDQIAQAASQQVHDRFAEVSGCAEATNECARAFVLRFAEKAFRRTLRDDERQRLLDRFASFSDVVPSITAAQLAQYGVMAVLESPQFLYRTELGENGTEAGPLTSSEVASLLSYLLTDDAPDAELLEAAAQDVLSNPEQVGEQVDRLLQTPKARANLEAAMMSYLGYAALESVVIQDPAFTQELRASMFQEGRRFLRDKLWQGPLADLLLSRDTFVNAPLASIYGVSPFPAAGASPDELGFARVRLPEPRAGLLTQAAFLTYRSRPDGPSVVARGLSVKFLFIGTQNPPAPPGLSADRVAPADASERELAEWRAGTTPCAECHRGFDAYGLALHPYDALGRYRQLDERNRPIDPWVTLPNEIGGGTAADVTEVAERLVEGGFFARCMTKSLLTYALGEATEYIAPNNCAVTEGLPGTDVRELSFSDAVRAAATSAALLRRAEPPP
jgi:hypothetical protein